MTQQHNSASQHRPHHMVSQARQLGHRPPLWQIGCGGPLVPSHGFPWCLTTRDPYSTYGTPFQYVMWTCENYCCGLQKTSSAVVWISSRIAIWPQHCKSPISRTVACTLPRQRGDLSGSLSVSARGGKHSTHWEIQSLGEDRTVTRLGCACGIPSSVCPFLYFPLECSPWKWFMVWATVVSSVGTPNSNMESNAIQAFPSCPFLGTREVVREYRGTGAPRVMPETPIPQYKWAIIWNMSNFFRMCPLLGWMTEDEMFGSSNRGNESAEVVVLGLGQSGQLLLGKLHPCYWKEGSLLRSLWRKRERGALIFPFLIPTDASGTTLWWKSVQQWLEVASSNNGGFASPKWSPPCPTCPLWWPYRYQKAWTFLKPSKTNKTIISLAKIVMDTQISPDNLSSVVSRVVVCYYQHLLLCMYQWFKDSRNSWRRSKLRLWAVFPWSPWTHLCDLSVA